jgi:hypothetical protein
MTKWFLVVLVPLNQCSHPNELYAPSPIGVYSTIAECIAQRDHLRENSFQYQIICSEDLAR